MDDQSSVPQDAVDLMDEPMSLDAMTAELKAEFARLELAAQEEDSEAVRRAKSALDMLDVSHLSGRSARCTLTGAIDRAMLALTALSEVEGLTSGSLFNRHSRYWSAVLAYCLSALAKLNSLLARSQRAFLRAPLLADGPELSGYKHRLR
ncbi:MULTISPECIES: hypothetical protein [Pseudomonas]|uniref:hypothetical protein n=1 Tax=Pseudomonas TaxID=286 RepID=UPI00117A4DE3|nr:MULTISPECIES: hypothetical protein [Pseudomonas]HEK0905494.1 hypothetical protein [Pseudomonas putida]